MENSCPKQKLIACFSKETFSCTENRTREKRKEEEQHKGKKRFLITIEQQREENIFSENTWKKMKANLLNVLIEFLIF